MTAPTGVILLYMGGPETLADVKPFLRELFSDRDLIQLPGGRLLQRPFALLISTLRAPKVMAHTRTNKTHATAPLRCATPAQPVNTLSSGQARGVQR